MHLVFWQNILSPHQAPLIRALGELGHDVTVVSAEAMEAGRSALGWNVPDMGAARVVVGPCEDAVRQLISDAPPDAIHVMAGARLVSLGKQAIQECLRLNRRVGIMSEAPDPRGILYFGRWAKYALERYSRGLHYDFVLAMGDLGVKWFRCVGYPAARVFPFAYVAEPVPPSDHGSIAGLSNEVSFLFVGRFVALKGLDLLLKAFSALPTKSARLHLLGDGVQKSHLQALAEAMGVQDRVEWLSKRDSAAVRRVMEEADITVLPSRKDGWGAVVNESLMAGTPVICSTACGAAELIRESWLGTVFESGDVTELTAVMADWVRRGPRSKIERQRIRNWSSCISGEAVAEYFSTLLEHVYGSGPRPSAPWRVAREQISQE